MNVIKDLIWGRYTLAIIVIVIPPLLLIFPIALGLKYTLFLISLPLSVLAIYDFIQKIRSLLANYPLIGRMRFLFESIRPELRQYFWESDDDKVPYSRNQRSMVYQRAKNIHGIRPFGSLEEMYGDDYVWLNHSITPSVISDQDFRVKVGLGENAYNISVLNISGTS